MAYHSTKKLEEMDTVYTNRNRDGLLRDCCLGALRRRSNHGSPACRPDECATCGWNPREQKRREEDALKKHKDGLWGF